MPALTELRIQNFKSWADTGPMRLAPITGLFGTNSSGKSSILQFLLMLKQTIESTDATPVLNFGSEQSIVDLGTFYEIVHGRQHDRHLIFQLGWQKEGKTIPNGISKLAFRAEVGEPPFSKLMGVNLISFEYVTDDSDKVGLKFDGEYPRFDDPDIGVYTAAIPQNFYSVRRGFTAVREDRASDAQLKNHYDEYARRITERASALEDLFTSISYIGPLRSHPARTYMWGGFIPSNVGQFGERTVQTLIASRLEPEALPALERVAYWLKEMGLIEEFGVESLAEERRLFEIRIKKTTSSPFVSLADVGFGISQILPVLTECYRVPSRAIVLLEQPELHLHPSVQSKLADVFIDVAKERKIQIIFESHSEHLLRRLQRRIAEEKLSAEDTALCFCEMKNGASQLIPLQVDPFGSITNWPKDFFGDEMGDLSAMTIAAMQRQKN